MDRNAALSKPARCQWRTASDAISRTSAKKIGMRIESQMGSMKSTPLGCYRARSIAGKGGGPREICACARPWCWSVLVGVLPDILQRVWGPQRETQSARLRRDRGHRRARLAHARGDAGNARVAGAVRETRRDDGSRRIRSRWSGVRTTTCGSRNEPPDASLASCPSDGSTAVAITIGDLLADGPGGLLGMALDPGLLKGTGNDHVYVAYTYDADANPATVSRRTKIVRFTYDPRARMLGNPQGHPGQPARRHGSPRRAARHRSRSEAVFHDRRPGRQPARQLLQAGSLAGRADGRPAARA